MLSLDATPIPDPGVIGRVVESQQPGKTEAVLVLPGPGKLNVLNEVGARIWAHLDGKRSVREIARIIAAEYSVSEQQAENDTAVFVESLVKKGICRLEEPAG